MDILQSVLYIAHMIALLAILAGPIVAGRGHLIQTWGARLQLLIGLGLVAVAEVGDGDVNNAKIGLKLVIAIAVVACAEIGSAKSKRGENRPALNLAWAAAILALVNTGVAFLW